MTKFLVSVLLGALAGPVLANDPVPDKYDAAPTGSDAAAELAMRCIPGTTAEAYQKMAGDARPGSVTYTWPTSRTASFLAVNAKRTICGTRAASGQPILPLEAFEKTVDFDGMPPEMQAAMRTSLSRQLAREGAARVLVRGDKNAYALTFLFASDRPTRLYYQGAWLKEGEFVEAQYPAVFRWTGPMSVIARFMERSSTVGDRAKQLFGD
jgi:hypothetical protein